VKILMSGGTRCNITQATDNRGIVAAYGPSGRFLHSALAALSVADTIRMFENEGVTTKVEPTGKIFPQSNKAADVLAALVRRLERSGCELATDEAVLEIERDAEGRFQAQTLQRVVQAAKLLITTGGQSYPGCGTVGEGYRWAAKLGHTIVPPRPALVPITTGAAGVAALKGITIPDVAVAVIENEGPSTIKKPLASRRGSLLFTHFGLSGPVVLDVSRAVSGHPRPSALSLVGDFLPDLKRDALEHQLRAQAAAEGKKQLISLLPDLLPRRLSETLLSVAQLSPERKAAEISNRDWSRVVEALKQAVIPISGTRGFKQAEVTAGGVALNEVDSSTMQSKLVPGLYLAGEVLDLDGPIGGYNFQAAWSTGYLAGRSV
jgi:predicted Rossmann fold flavoprotein